MSKGNPDSLRRLLDDQKLALVICWGLMLVLALLLAGNLYMAKGEEGGSVGELPPFIAVQQPSGETLMVGATEVTVDQWRICEQAQVCPLLSEGQRGSSPMVNMSWADVRVFIRWSAARQGLPLRVPTKAEWLVLAAEQAATKRKPLFTDPRMAWAADYDLTALPVERKTRAVTAFGANSLGIYDIKGNVWEWVAACYYPQPGLPMEVFGCMNGRVAMGEREVGLSEQLRSPGNTGCGGGQPPANVGFRLVYSALEAP